MEACHVSSSLVPRLLAALALGQKRRAAAVGP
jgi:hypothetical protein